MSEVEGYDSDAGWDEYLNATENIANGNINVETVKQYLQVFDINPTVIDSIVNKKLWNKTADRKKYDKEYNEKYYQKRKEKNTTIICDVCNGRYNKYSKQKHDLTNRHIQLSNQNNNLN
jgi:hypothetical protein